MNIEKLATVALEDMTMKIVKVFNRTRTTMLVTFILVSVCYTLAAGIFLGGVARYTVVNSWIKSVEQEAEKGSWTSNGYVHWTEDLTEEGLKAKEVKEELIKASDVARWCYYSGFSKTGQVIRVAAILGTILNALYTIYCVFIAILCIYFRHVPSKKKRSRRR